MDQVRSGLLSPLLRRERIRAAAPYLRGRVLDVGCGTGQLAGLCAAERYVGIDIDAESLALARRLWPGYAFRVDLPDGAERFDTIVALAVIEHVPQPAAWLRRLAALLAERGRIVLTTPHPAFEWCHSAGARFGLFSREAAQEHETLLGVESLERLARESELAIAFRRRFLLGVNQLFVLARREAA